VRIAQRFGHRFESFNLARRLVIASPGAGFSLVFAVRGDPLMTWLSFRHSLACLTQPGEWNEKPIAARSVFEREEE
jgi:hypothetical protein